MISYIASADAVTPGRLTGFFVGWPNPPSPETHLRILNRSDEVILAVDDQTDQVVGFITAITDGLISAYLPLLEVLPAYQGRGIGKALVRRMTERLGNLYMIDLVCDEAVQQYYKPLGFTPCHGMAKRSYENQNCEGAG